MIILKKTINLKLFNLEFSKNKFRNYFGNMGEVITEETLTKKGFIVWKWNSHSVAEAFLGSKFKRNLGHSLSCLYPVKAAETRIIDGDERHFTYERLFDCKPIIKEIDAFFVSIETL